MRSPIFARRAHTPCRSEAFFEALERRTLLAADIAGATIDTATDLNLGSEIALVKEKVGGRTDPADVYRIVLDQDAALRLHLSDLRADANLQLLDADGEVIASSALPKRMSEYIDEDLAAGTYYVRVAPVGRANTRYTLRAASDAGHADLGQLTESFDTTGYVGNLDRADRFTFELTGRTEFSLTLDGLLADADVELLDAAGDVIARSERAGRLSEWLQETLEAGTYTVEVYQYSGDTTYALSLGVEALPELEEDAPLDGDAPAYSTTFGYGLIDAGAAVALAAGVAVEDVPTFGGANDWNLNLVRAPEAWDAGFTGAGVVVAVIDTGVDWSHTDLDASIWTNPGEIAGNGIDDDDNGYVDDIRGWDFVSDDATPQDGNGHGTHVAGTIAGENNGSGVTGVAYDARIMPVRVLDNRGSGWDSDVAAGIRYAAANGADVINLSLGGSTGNPVLFDAIAYASSLGSIVVMAAGNEGRSSPGYPAMYSTHYGLSVGALDKTGKMASFSNRSGTATKDYVMAPGVAIYSTTPGNKYATWNGTSMATPHVAGVAALIRQANPALTAPQVEAILVQTARPNMVTV